MIKRLTRSETGYLLNAAARRWNARFVEALGQRGIADIKPSFGAVLVPLFEEDGLRPGDLARRAGLSKQTMTSLVRPIERAGYLERRPDPGDGRAVRLHLTAKARAIEPAVEAVLDQLEGETARLARPLPAAAILAWLAAVGSRPTETPGAEENGEHDDGRRR